jgi:hypothetical protein
MGQSDGLRQIFIESQRARNVAGDSGHFHRMCETGPQVIARSVEKDLGLIFEPAKRA